MKIRIICFAVGFSTLSLSKASETLLFTRADRSVHRQSLDIGTAALMLVHKETGTAQQSDLQQILFLYSRDGFVMLHDLIWIPKG